ncbi:MAG: flotillin [Fimbriimonadaceae bacterium]|nr:flotillin [Fimbriimonadaceae bacterium]
MTALALGLLLVLVILAIAFVASLRNLIYTCAPNEVLIFSGPRHRVGEKLYNYEVVKGGSRIRWPLMERVDRMDLSNMAIDISAQNAYSKGGIPLTVQGVANVKIAGYEPLLNNAIERFLGRSRIEIMNIAKATLEGSLRGILATMTPEQVNEDMVMFAERLVQEVEQDMTSLGLVVDTMKIQTVADDVKYLDSLGRKRNAEVVSYARIAEAVAHADSIVRSAENLQKESEAQINAHIEMFKADAQKRLTDALTRRAAVVAEEQSQVIALVAQAKAELDVQAARVEQMRGKLDADVIQPAVANALASEAQARASTASIIEDGKARAEALTTLAETWRKAGPNARDVLLTQKLDSVIRAIVDVIPETEVEKITMIGTGGGSAGKFPTNAIGTLEQIKQIFGIDIVEKVKAFGAVPNGKSEQPALERPVPIEWPQEQQQTVQVKVTPTPTPKPKVPPKL